jgi:hypothetical protein
MAPDLAKGLQTGRSQAHGNAGLVTAVLDANNLAFRSELHAGLIQVHLEGDGAADVVPAADYEVHPRRADVARHCWLPVCERKWQLERFARVLTVLSKHEAQFGAALDRTYGLFCPIS